jgi:hypothetical protein
MPKFRNTVPSPKASRYQCPGVEVGLYELYIVESIEEVHNNMHFTVEKKEDHLPFLDIDSSGVPRGVWGVQTPPSRNSEALTKLSRIPSSVENTYVTT